MKIYDYNTVFQFGKHKGKKLVDIVTSDWPYINWCQEHLDHFIFANEMMYVLEEPNGEFQFSKLALEKRQKNLELLRVQKKEFDEIKLENQRDIQTEIEQEELDNYNPFTEQSGDYDNTPDFGNDPFDEHR